MRGFVCVISVRGLSSLDAWLRDSIGIFVSSLGFTKCFCKSFRSLEIILQPKGKKKNIFIAHGKNRNIFVAHFEAWNSFRSLEIILQPFQSQKGKRNIFAAHGKNRNIFAAHFEAWRSFPQRGEDFEVWKIISQSKGHFRSKWRIWQGVAMGLQNHFTAKGNFAAHFDAWRSLRSCENFRRGGHGAAKSFRNDVAISQGAISSCEISQTTEFVCF